MTVAAAKVAARAAGMATLVVVGGTAARGALLATVEGVSVVAVVVVTVTLVAKRVEA